MSSTTTTTSLLLCAMLAVSGCYVSRSTGGGEDGMKVQEIRFDKISDEPRLSPPGSDFTAFGQSSKRITDMDDIKETFNLMVMNNLGNARTVIAPEGDHLSGPAWSPDAKQIYFATDFGISVVPAAEGETAVEIVADTWPMDPDVSPDGKSLVYATKDGTMKIVELTTNPPALKDLELIGTSPRFSPDGKTLAFAADRHINLLDLASGEVTQAFDCGTNLASESWFPDGKKMAVTSDAGVEIVTLGGDTPKHSLIYEQLGTKNVDVAKDGKFLIFTINGDTSMLALSEYVLSDF